MGGGGGGGGGGWKDVKGNDSLYNILCIKISAVIPLWSRFHNENE